MIEADFIRKGSRDGLLFGFTVKGHAGWADRGEDVVCAAVSSAVELACNTITDFFGVDAEVIVVPDEGRIELYLPPFAVKDDSPSVKLISSLMEHLIFISEDYPGTVSVTVR
ncbi:MAG: ribosomal-processing cysteine protease Prp [Oscillospiraceae bacterium]|nr:ribosomal-processing cysteine protease Prp [Oscillospiraceae bacterium]MBQ8979435.1 ribosomal-processing cysteine protease Prp [Oscillospiraceae bacterium]